MAQRIVAAPYLSFLHDSVTANGEQPLLVIKHFLFVPLLK